MDDTVWRTGNIRVARIGGISIEVHITFILVILWGAWQGWYQYGGAYGAAYGVLLISLLFGCILLHELGHGLQARAFNLTVRGITLLPIGGIAQLETPPLYPWQELLIALAGPLVNLAVAMFLGVIAYAIQPFVFANWVDHLLEFFYTPTNGFGILIYLVGTNLVLFIFNMLPAFPMDGGRVVRAATALAFDYEVATRLSAWLGRILAAGMSIFGLIGWPPAGIPPNPLLIVLGLMVFLGARQEEVYVRRQRALVHVEVHQVALRTAETLAPWDTISGNLIAKLFKQEQSLPVIVEGRVVGLLTYHDLRRVYRHGDSPLTVAHVMRTSFPSLRLRDTLWVALQEMNAYQLAALPVVDNGMYLGVVRLDDINHAWRFAMRRKRGLSTLVSGD